jgi:hypothetical protein
MTLYLGEMRIICKHFLENLEGIDHLNGLGAGMRIILKWSGGAYVDRVYLTQYELVVNMVV